MKHTLSLILLFLVVLTGQAAITIEDGHYYVFRNLSTGLVLSNGSTTARNATLKAESYNEQGDPAQQWQLNAIEGQEGVYQFVNTDFALAIDMALTSGGSNPLQWSPNKSNTNQHLLITPVEGTDDVVTIGTSPEYAGTPKYIGDYYTEYIKYFGFVSSRTDRKAFWQVIPVEHTAYVRPDWQNEAVFAIGKEDAHATYLPYPTTQALRADAARYEKPWLEPTGNSRWMSLNGTWKISWQDKTADMPDMAVLTASTSTPSGIRLSNVSVPGCLEMQGFGTPYYLNDNYPFDDAPPYISMKSGVENGVGSYRRTFTLPSEWTGERVYLHFDGIYGGAYIWLNGQQVGYSQGSNNDAEFDITPYLKTGTNVLGVQNIRWTDGSYLEGQDMWHMSGIHRDVYLYALPEGSVRDHWLTSELSNNYSQARLTAHIRGGQQVVVTLIAPDGQEVAHATATPSEEEGILTASFDVTDVQLWSAECPTLYTVEFSQLDAKGQEQMAFATKYGFRQITNDGKLIKINGKRVYFRGVNTQDTDPKFGRTMPIETMLQDIMLMKQANVNTVRTSHYPRSPRMMDMFDYYGLYVMDEADNECHHNWTDFGTSGISSQTSWLPAMQDRTDRMVMRDRNHASVIFWSLGNESCWGRNFTSLYDAVHALDGESGRPIHYEGATRGYAEGQTDLYSVMYPTVSAVSNKAAINSQPFFICEYAHAMGNAIGNLREYWDAIYGSKFGVGACIWDWVDQSIYDAADIKNNALSIRGLPKFKTGFDYGSLHQNNFINNGILTAERTPNGKYAEVKAVYSPVQLASANINTKTLRFKNIDSFTNLNTYGCHYEVLLNGVVVEQGRVELPSIAPQNSSAVPVTIPFTTKAPEGEEMLLNVHFTLPEATSWADAGHTIATFQQVVQQRMTSLPERTGVEGGDISFFQNGTRVNVGNDKFNLAFDTDGNLLSYNIGDTNYILEGPEYSNFRWIENDRNLSTDSKLGEKTAEFLLANDRRTATVKVTETGSRCPYTLTYTIHPDGVFDIDASMHPADNDLLRIGLAMTFAEQLENVDYWGRGPEENYWDRKDGCYIGRYQTTVTDLFEHYPHPQTCGGREDIREVILSDELGVGLRITTSHAANRQIAMQLLHYRDEDMTATRLHPYDLKPQNEVYAHFDIYQRGLGNGSCGQGTGTISSYLCPTSGTQNFSLRFAPYDRMTDGITSAPLAQGRPTAIYDLQGRTLQKPTRGLYIQAGKKYLHK